MSWTRQEKGKPLYPDMLWSKPENKRYAGKLLIIGGQAGSFKNISAAYSYAVKAGAGHVRLLMPESLRKLTQSIEGAEYAPSNQSGSFARTALGAFFELSEWSDHILLAGDLGKSSETTVIVDGFLLRTNKSVTISENALQSVGIDMPQLINKKFTLVGGKVFIQNIVKTIGHIKAVTSETTIGQMSEILEDVSSKYRAALVVGDGQNIWTSEGGDVVSTKSNIDDINKLSAYSSVWQMQNPNKIKEALATAAFEATNN